MFNQWHKFKLCLWNESSFFMVCVKAMKILNNYYTIYWVLEYAKGLGATYYPESVQLFEVGFNQDAGPKVKPKIDVSSGI